ncbi:uncharacterized protein LOC112541982 [Python bivittatus]|uniref:Uncharacterized protein LOC112541982 n=1 Tax=Python bivittatus TaxID=176946 RepID=A0A9F5MYP4_PYTBI|nr:uncharacterized protein LOC112541982 [Python bivittatus]
MDSRGSGSPSLPAEPRCSMSDNINYGDEELDQETMNFISALYAALGPLLPEVTKLQGHQDPPAHLMVDMKAKLRELGSSVSDARKRLLKYNIYLKKKLARAMQERKALREQQLRQQGINEQVGTSQMQSLIRAEMSPGKSSLGTEKNILEIPSAELVKIKPERSHRRTIQIPGACDLLRGEGGRAGRTLTPTSSVPSLASQDTMEERARSCMTPQGILQRSVCKMENSASRPPLDRSHL